MFTPRSDRMIVLLLRPLRSCALEILERARQTGAAGVGVEQHRQRHGLEPALVDVTKPRELLVVDDRRLHADLAARLGAGLQRFASGPIVDPIDVTSSSRIASSGGFVTCANNCVK